MITPTDLGKVREGARLANALPDLRSYISEQENKIIQQALLKLQDGSLTPELGLYAWMEVASLRKILRNIETKIRVGVSYAEAHAPEFEIR